MIELVTGPQAEPLHIKQVKKHLRVDYDDDDVYIESLIPVARQALEKYRDEAHCVQTFDLKMDDWPSDEVIYIYKYPVLEITSITYTDSNGDSQTWASTNYVLENPIGRWPRIKLAYGATFPSARVAPESITVRFVAGFLNPVSDVDNPNDTITVAGRDYDNGDKVRVFCVGGEDKSFPGGLAENTDYYVVSASGSTLKLSTTSGGTAVDLLSSGVGNLYLGYEGLPQFVQAAMLILITDLYDNRESVIQGETMARLHTFDALVGTGRMNLV